MWGVPRSWMPGRCQHFSFISEFSALAIVAAKLEMNEIGYAGDTPAATVSGITDPGYQAASCKLL
jgi:hypothetical protein